MTDRDVFGFSQVMTALARVFPKRGGDEELRSLNGAYFKALRTFPLADVQAAADAWTTTGKYFPKPAELIGAIPRVRAAVVEMPELPAVQAQVWLEAARCGDEHPPCSCAACVSAGMQERPVRFVPDLGADGEERRVRLGDRVVCAGHWAHGTELARWYQARAAFWNHCAELGLLSTVEAKQAEKQPLMDRLEKIFAKREAVAR